MTVKVYDLEIHWETTEELGTRDGKHSPWGPGLGEERTGERTFTFTHRPSGHLMFKTVYVSIKCENKHLKSGEIKKMMLI